MPGQGMSIPNANNPFGAVAMWPSRSITPPTQPETEPGTRTPRPADDAGNGWSNRRRFQHLSGLCCPFFGLSGRPGKPTSWRKGPMACNLVDQHAAHERVLYEEISQRIGSQGLRIPAAAHA